MYTRNVEQKVVDSKRWPHIGSCIGNKRAIVTTTSLLPELAIGDPFPGITSCIQSYGSPGCDWFYLSSGCLFYRIYAVPSDEQLYELYRCNRLKEEVKLCLNVYDVKEETNQAYVSGLRPNVPTRIQNMDVTMRVPLRHHSLIWSKCSSLRETIQQHETK